MQWHAGLHLMNAAECSCNEVFPSEYPSGEFIGHFDPFMRRTWYDFGARSSWWRPEIHGSSLRIQDLEKTWGIRCYPHSHAPEVLRYLSISGLSWNNGPVLCILWESSMGLAPPEPCRSRKRSGAQMLGQSLVSCIPWVNFIHFDPLWSTLGLSWCQLYPICGLSTEDLCGGRLQTFLWEHHKDLGERLVRVWTPPGWEAGQAAPCPERERAERLGQRFANHNCLPFGAMFSMFRYVWDMFAVYFLERR